MNAEDHKVTTMFATVATVLETYTVKIAMFPAILAVVLSLKELLKTLDEFVMKQTVITKGRMLVRTGARLALMKLLNLHRYSLYAHATETGKLHLIEKVGDPNSTLAKMKSRELLILANVVEREVQPEITSLADYGVSLESFQQLHTAAEAFARSCEEFNGSRAESVAARANITDIVKKGNSILVEKLDKLMDRFRFDDIDMYTAYTNARKIQRAASHRKRKPGLPPKPGSKKEKLLNARKAKEAAAKQKAAAAEQEAEAAKQEAAATPVETNEAAPVAVDPVASIPQPVATPAELPAALEAPETVSTVAPSPATLHPAGAASAAESPSPASTNGVPALPV